MPIGRFVIAVICEYHLDVSLSKHGTSQSSNTVCLDASIIQTNLFALTRPWPNEKNIENQLLLYFPDCWNRLLKPAQYIGAWLAFAMSPSSIHPETSHFVGGKQSSRPYPYLISAGCMLSWRGYPPVICTYTCLILFASSPSLFYLWYSNREHPPLSRSLRRSWQRQRTGQLMRTLH